MANSEKRGQQLKRILERIADSFLEISNEEISTQDIEAWGNAEEAEHVRAILRSAVEVGRDSASHRGRVEFNDTLAHATAQVRPLDNTARVAPTNATALEVLSRAIRAVSAARLNMLSKREQEVVQHVAEGLTNGEIGSRMGLSQLTVKNYLFRIFDKLGASNRVELLSLTLQPSASHPAGTDRKENSVMRGIAVAILTEHREQQLLIQNRVEATGVARIVFSHPAFPLNATDSIIRQLQDQRTEVVIVDLHPENLRRALDAIELIQNTTSNIAIFAMGEMSIPMNIVAAMRAGACEYVSRQAGNECWLNAFARFAARTKKHVRTRKKRDGIDGTGGSAPPGESAPPAVPVLSPRGGGPPTLPPRKATWET